ncbi:hypothetical protein AVEN_98257-1, partial [Araneus ventricosus]
MSLSLCKMSYKPRSKCPTNTPFFSFASDKPGNWSQRYLKHSPSFGIVYCRNKTSDGATMKEECNVKCVAVVYSSENSLSLLLCFELLKRHGNSKGKRLASTALVVIHQRHKTQFYDIKAFKTARLHASPSTGTHADHRSFLCFAQFWAGWACPKMDFHPYIQSGVALTPPSPTSSVIHGISLNDRYKSKTYTTAFLPANPSSGSHSNHCFRSTPYTILGRLGRCGLPSIRTLRSPTPTFSDFLGETC